MHDAQKEQEGKIDAILLRIYVPTLMMDEGWETEVSSGDLE